jgi:hypothetical protein
MDTIDQFADAFQVFEGLERNDVICIYNTQLPWSDEVTGQFRIRMSHQAHHTAANNTLHLQVSTRFTHKECGLLHSQTLFILTKHKLIFCRFCLFTMYDETLSIDDTRQY